VSSAFLHQALPLDLFIPLSKQRNRHLQTIVIEAAKMAPRHSPALAMIYDREKQTENANRATWPWRGNWWRT
jgi:hypothetical protein